MDQEVLERGTDYTVNGQNVTIKTTYLEKIKSQSSTKLVLNSKMGRHRHSRLILTFRNRGILYKNFAADGADGFTKKEWKRFYESGKWCHEVSGRWRIY